MYGVPTVPFAIPFAEPFESLPFMEPSVAMGTKTCDGEPFAGPFTLGPAWEASGVPTGPFENPFAKPFAFLPFLEPSVAMGAKTCDGEPFAAPFGVGGVVPRAGVGGPKIPRGSAGFPLPSRRTVIG
jgi:hypothetical protein